MSTVFRHFGSKMELFREKSSFFSLDAIARNIESIDREMDSSTALESYGSLLSNAPSLTTIREVLAKLQHETSARKTKFFKVKIIPNQNFL